MKKILVPYLDLAKSYSLISPQLQRAFLKVLKSGRVILGKEVAEFEEAYAKFSSTKYCAGVGNGLDALVLSLQTLGIKENDEVIVPANTYIATLIAVSRLNAVPVLVEPKKNTYNIDPHQIGKAVTKKTKAIIPVHLFGQACQMNAILDVAKKNKLFVVEDNAQAQGATFGGKRTGSFGDINATSFYPGKNLGALGDAGAITTNDKAYYENILMLRNYGERKRYDNQLIGYNSRLDELQAAFLKIRLESLGEINRNKQRIAEMYLKNLHNIGDLILPEIEKDATHVYHIFAVRTKRRDSLSNYLRDNGITTLIHYPIPPHLSRAYEYLKYKKGDFPITEELADTSLSLPIFPEMSDSQIEYVIEKIKDFFK